MVGNDPSLGVYSPGSEGAHGVLVVGGTNIEVVNVTISAIWGDCLFVGSWPTTVATGVTFRDSTCASAGRQGVTITSGSNVTVERVDFRTSGYCMFDIDPNFSSEVASNIKFLDNTVGTWSNSFLSADGAAGSSVSGVTVSGNTVTGGTLLTIIDLARRSNIVFTNHTSDVSTDGPVLRFDHIDGLTVSGNIQPLRSGPLAAILDSTDVTYSEASAPASSCLPRRRASCSPPEPLSW